MNTGRSSYLVKYNLDISIHKDGNIITKKIKKWKDEANSLKELVQEGKPM